MTNAMTVFNWLVSEDYMTKNPSKGRLKKLKVTVTKHRWYDRDTAKIVKESLINAEVCPVYRASRFKHYYVFGQKGVPDKRSCRKDFLAEEIKKVRDDLALSDLYLIYSWKYTDPYTIMHMFRHKDLQVMQKYLKDFDINLSYPAADLTF